MIKNNQLNSSDVCLEIRQNEKKCIPTLTFTVLEGNGISIVARRTPLAGIPVGVVEAGETVTGDVVARVGVEWVDIVVTLAGLTALPCDENGKK